MTFRGILWTVAALAAVAALGAAAWVRLAPMDPGVWHVRPDPDLRSPRPNDAFAGPGGDVAAPVLPMAPADALARLDAVALAEPRTVRLAGGPEAGFVTYVQRSGLMGYPDAISVLATPEGEGTRLTMWSRSRYGHSDLGVNAARLARWTEALTAP